MTIDALNQVDDVSFVEQEFGKVCAILPSGAGNQSHAFCHECPVRKPVSFTIAFAEVAAAISFVYTKT